MKGKGRVRRLVQERAAFSPAELAVLLGVSRPVVYRWIAQGQLRTVRLGKRLQRIPAEEVSRLLRGERP